MPCRKHPVHRTSRLYPAIRLASGVPVWWKLTAIHRPELPHADIADLAARLATTPPLLPSHLYVHLAAHSAAILRGTLPEDTSNALDWEQEALLPLQARLQAAAMQRAPGMQLHLRLETDSSCSPLSRRETVHEPVMTPEGAPWNARCVGLLAAAPGLLAAPLGDADDRLAALLQAAGAPDAVASYHLFLLPALAAPAAPGSTSSGSADGAAASRGHQHVPRQRGLAAVAGRRRHAWAFYQDGELAVDGVQAAVEQLAAALHGPGNSAPGAGLAMHRNASNPDL